MKKMKMKMMIKSLSEKGDWLRVFEVPVPFFG